MTERQRTLTCDIKSADHRPPQRVQPILNKIISTVGKKKSGCLVDRRGRTNLRVVLAPLLAADSPDSDCQPRSNIWLSYGDPKHESGIKSTFGGQARLPVVSGFPVIRRQSQGWENHPDGRGAHTQQPNKSQEKHRRRLHSCSQRRAGGDFLTGRN